MDDKKWERWGLHGGLIGVNTAISFVGFIAFLLWLAWIAAVSLVLIERKSEPTAAAWSVR